MVYSFDYLSQESTGFASAPLRVDSYVALERLKLQSPGVWHLFELLELVVLEAFTSYFNYIQAVGRSDIKQVLFWTAKGAVRYTLA